MPQYRDDRGSLADSMATVITVNSIQEIIDHINKDLIAVTEIKVEPYGYDSRINWDAHLVSIKHRGYDSWTSIGFTSGAITENKTN